MKLALLMSALVVSGLGAEVSTDSATGYCREALSLFRTAVARKAEAGRRKQLGIAGVRCAMTGNDLDGADEIVRELKKQFPHDPDVLYLAVHVFSDLSLRASQELSATAAGSYQALELNAEGLEADGKREEAIAAYREVLKREPTVRGIHYRIGRLLLSGPNRAAATDEARREFEEELKIDPSSAAAEYVLGELARQDQQTAAAIEHFGRATKLDDGFTDAFIGLGRSLLDSDRVPDAIEPLRIATKLQPGNAAAHLYLATAYQRSGHQEDARREFALQQQASEHRVK